MSDHLNLPHRPPIGFVVEGEDEYASYPSLVSRIAGATGFKIPIENAGSSGSVVRNLQIHLTHLVATNHPYEIIVTLDLRDAIRKPSLQSCSDLADAMVASAESWLSKAPSDSRLIPIPHRISIVIQIQSFESWMISDVASLQSAGFIYQGDDQPAGVDSAILNPYRWLEDRMISPTKIKTPRIAKSIISQLDCSRMRTNSKSFDKFYREVSSSYSRWSKEKGFS